MADEDETDKLSTATAAAALNNCEVLTANDTNDPSFTNLVLPYRVICRQRYHRAGVEQRAQLIREIKRQEMGQTRALDGVRVHREFANAVLQPAKATEIVRLTEKQRFKLEELLKE